MLFQQSLLSKQIDYFSNNKILNLSLQLHVSCHTTLKSLFSPVLTFRLRNLTYVSNSFYDEYSIILNLASPYNFAVRRAYNQPRSSCRMTTWVDVVKRYSAFEYCVIILLAGIRLPRTFVMWWVVTLETRPHQRHKFKYK